jgi:hypothetical protein
MLIFSYCNINDFTRNAKSQLPLTFFYKPTERSHDLFLMDDPQFRTSEGPILTDKSKHISNYQLASKG